MAITKACLALGITRSLFFQARSFLGFALGTIRLHGGRKLIYCRPGCD
jgi:hypothetical protein